MSSLLPRLLRQVQTMGLTPGKGLNIVAFSGGVDSSVVAVAVSRVFPANTIACIGVSNSLPSEQYRLAADIAKQFALQLEEVSTNEGQDATYLANEGQSCYICKSHLYRTMQAIGDKYGPHEYAGNGDNDHLSSAGKKIVMFNGTNADDLQDPTRVGLIAASEFDVRSPLEDFPKNYVRALARELGLPNHDHSASPCLRSRLQFGVQASEEHLLAVGKAESYLRRSLSLPPQCNLRVRLLANQSSAIEVDDDRLQVVTSALSQDVLLHSHLDSLGFSNVHVRCFKTGSVAISNTKTI